MLYNYFNVEQDEKALVAWLVPTFPAPVPHLIERSQMDDGLRAQRLVEP